MSGAHLASLLKLHLKFLPEVGIKEFPAPFLNEVELRLLRKRS